MKTQLHFPTIHSRKVVNDFQIFVLIRFEAFSASALQVTLQRKTRVTAIATKGRLHKPSWVTSYYIQYSTDGNNWLNYTETGLPKVRHILNSI